MCEYPIHSVSERFFSMLGFARKAGKTVLGTEVICDKMRAKKKLVLVLVSQYASNGTKEKLIYKCEFYNIPYYVVDVTLEKLGSICGKSGVLAACAITDPMFSEQIQKECLK